MSELSNWKAASNQEIRAKQLQILVSFSAHCKKLGLRFFLMYGTLLGAVRHQGYIPWDDDIDLVMFREDYDKLLSSNIRMPIPYVIKSRKLIANFPFYYAKICDESTRLEEFVDGKAYSIGINVDLFIFDQIPCDKSMRKKVWKNINQLKRPTIVKNIDTRVDRSWYKAIALTFLNSVVYRKEHSYYYDKLEKYLKKYKGVSSSCVLEVMTPYGIKSIIDSKMFEHTAYLPFEGYMMPVPSEYDAVLRQFYGDYMELPPIDKRMSHHSFEAFIRSTRDEEVQE